jgi:hypothetical protein
MRQSQEGRVEELSRKLGGRFKLTTLVQKQARGYYLGGRAFMPDVRNLDELFGQILDEIDDDKIALQLRESAQSEDVLSADEPPAEEE